MEYVKWTPHPVIVTIRDNRDHIRVLFIFLLYHLQGGGVLLRYTVWK